MIIFSKNGDLHGYFSSLPNKSYLDESKWTIAELPEGESFDLDYEYSCVEGVAIKGSLIPENLEENARIKADYDAKKYQRDRAVAFPSLQEQLDMQYWDKVNGTNKWQESVAKVKADNPKPE